MGISKEKEYKVEAGISRFTSPFPSDYGFFPSYSVDDELNVNVQGGYAFNKKFAVQSSLLFVKGHGYGHKYYYYQHSASIGRFFRFDFEKERKNGKIRKKYVLIDMYLGTSFGVTGRNFNGYDQYGRTNLKYMKGFATFGMYYHWGKFTELSFGTRFTYLDYVSLVQINDTPSSFESGLDAIRERDPFFLMEYTPKIKMGREWLHVYGSYTFFDFRTSEGAETTKYSGTYLVGIELGLSDLLEWRKERRAKKKNK